MSLYGYGELLSEGTLEQCAALRPAVKRFTIDDNLPHEYVATAVDEFLRRARTNRIAVQSLEWALGELVGNVFHHAESAIGLLVQFLVQPGNQCIFSIVDTGIGIRRSLEEEHKISSDLEAIELAVQKGITSKRFNAGQGLFGSAAIVEASHGSFMLWSGAAALFIDTHGRREYRTMPYLQGTAIDWRMPINTRLDLRHVLQIKNEPLTLLWDQYDSIPGEIYFPIANEAKSFVDRSIGKKLCNKLITLTRDSAAKRCVVDFKDVRMISSSFADEFLAKFAVLMGQEYYKKFVRLNNVTDLMLGIINDAIKGRLQRERQERTPNRILGIHRNVE